MGEGSNGWGLRVALVLLTILAGVTTGLVAWTLANTHANALSIRELETLFRIYHPGWPNGGGGK